MLPWVPTEAYKPIETDHHRRFMAELESANKVIRDADALIVDNDWTGLDPTALPESFVSYYSGLVSAGVANGFI
jgi:hypothetical protein